MKLRNKTQEIDPLKLHKEYGSYKNIVEHSKAVARVALLIAKLIKQANPKVKLSLEEVKNAALLHDLDKTLTLKQNRAKAEKLCDKLNIPKSKIKHGELSYEILKRLGLKKYAIVARQHTYFKIISRDKPKTLLSKIIYYADKRCNEDKIVTLKERLKVWKDRYSKTNDEKTKGLVKKANKNIYELQDKLMKMMKLTIFKFNKKIKENKL